MEGTPDRTDAAGRCDEWVMISTESGLRWPSVMASDEASSTGGIWFSVEKWEGIAGELGRRLSWTSRSKIWEPAGETTRGDEAERARPGDGGLLEGCSSRGGHVVVGLVEDMPGGDLMNDDEAGSSDAEAVTRADTVALACSSSCCSCRFSSVFFLPKPKRPLFLPLSFTFV